MDEAMGGGAGDHPKKTSWPEVVGLGAIQAASRIMEDMPDVHIQLHYLGYHAPPGYNGHRVRLILVPEKYTVAITPCVG